MTDCTWSLPRVSFFRSREKAGATREGARRRGASRHLQLESLERRELLSTTQNFDGTGTTYSLQQVGGPPPAEVVPGGPTGQFLQLATTPLSPVAGNNNSISFVTSDPGTYQSVTADWDFRVTPGTGNGLGMSFALLNTGNYGTSGQAASLLPQQGIYSGSLAFGFETSTNTVYLSLNGAIQTAQSLTGQLNLATGQFIHAHAEVNFTGKTVSLVLTPTGGSAVTVFSNQTVTDLGPYQSRVSYQANNSSTTFATFDLDNVNVVYSGLRQAGTVSFGSPSYTALENQGVAQIDVQRVGGTAGAFSLSYVAANGTAQNGVNYVAVSGTLTFSEGQSTATINVPIIDDGLASGDKTVLLYLGNPTLSAPLAKPIVATLTIVNTDPIAPTVSSSVQLVYAGRTRRVAGFRLTFSQPMDEASAESLANYQVSLIGQRNTLRTLAISQAVVDPSGLSVTLYRADLGRVHLTKRVRIVVRGTPPSGLRDTGGTFLAGTGGVPGTDAILYARP